MNKNYFEYLCENPSITNLKKWYKECFPDLHFFDKETIRCWSMKFISVKIIQQVPYLLGKYKINLGDGKWVYEIVKFDPSNGWNYRIKSDSESDIKSVWKDLKKDYSKLEFER